MILPWLVQWLKCVGFVVSFLQKEVMAQVSRWTGWRKGVLDRAPYSLSGHTCRHLSLTVRYTGPSLSLSLLALIPWFPRDRVWLQVLRWAQNWEPIFHSTITESGKRSSVRLPLVKRGCAPHPAGDPLSTEIGEQKPKEFPHFLLAFQFFLSWDIIIIRFLFGGVSEQEILFFFLGKEMRTTI